MNARVSMILRILLGLILVIFGVNKFAGFLEMPPFEEGSAAANYMGGLFGSPYFGPLLGIVEILGGLALVLNRYVALALVVIAPVALNILLFHLTMDIGGGLLGYVLFALTLILLFVNKDKYAALLSPN